VGEPTATELEELRGRLRSFCYQLLGSPFDAEDAVQDVLERAWRHRADYEPDRAALSTWTLRIARNVCIDRLRATRRRPLPRDLAGPGIDLTAPLVPAPDVPWLMPAPPGWAGGSVVEQTVERSAEVRFAVAALLQTLPATQRAAFALREVLGLSAARTAQVLETSVPAVNSALQRARATVRAGLADGDGVDPGRVERYAAAIERADVPALVALVSDDVVLEMPPVPAWSRGAGPYAEFMTWLFEVRGTAWATRRFDSGLLLFALDGDRRVPHTLQLFDADSSGAIRHVLVYRDDRLFALFEEFLPAR
jgi:RNA polymerase sigma-70 factor, ECF subfamily